jgi:hypothetical protein
LDVNDTPNDDKMKLMSFVSIAFFSIPQIYGKGINHTNKILFFLYWAGWSTHSKHCTQVPALYPLIVIRYVTQRYWKDSI